MRGHHRSSRIERLGGDRGDIRLVVSAPPATRQTERARSYLPWPVRLLVKLGLPVLVLLICLDCRSRHDASQFFHGMTVSACTRQTVYGRIDAAQRQFEDVARAVAGR